MSITVDVAYKSLNKYTEILCGDKVEILQTEDSNIMILADGMGSGVKANILSTLTSKILGTMFLNGATLEECVETISETLPICQVRQVAYSTFSILQVYHNGDAYLVEYDIWLAQYNDKITYTGPGNIGMWQHTSTGCVPRVRGGTGNCDINECYRDYPSIICAGGWNNYPKTNVAPDVSWDTKEKRLKVGSSYAALCTVRNTSERAAVRVDKPEICAIERMGPDYIARSGLVGDLYTITAIAPGEARVIASLDGEDSASFPVYVEGVE